MVLPNATQRSHPTVSCSWLGILVVVGCEQGVSGSAKISAISSSRHGNIYSDVTAIHSDPTARMIKKG